MIKRASSNLRAPWNLFKCNLFIFPQPSVCVCECVSACGVCGVCGRFVSETMKSSKLGEAIASERAASLSPRSPAHRKRAAPSPRSAQPHTPSSLCTPQAHRCVLLVRRCSRRNALLGNDSFRNKEVKLVCTLKRHQVSCCLWLKSTPET